MRKRVVAIWKTLSEIAANIFHFKAIDRSGLFCADDYRRLYLDGRTSILPPLLHYLLIGERKGFRPNPFFDPSFSLATNGNRQLWRYLAQRRFWPCQSSVAFDGAFYLSQLDKSHVEGASPLEHFWRTGFDLDLDGSRTFQTAFFKRATARDVEDKRSFAASVLPQAHRYILSSQDLEQRQYRFVSSISLVFLKEQPSDRRNLVFVQAAAACRPDFADAARSFDVFMNYYEPVTDFDERCEIAASQKGTKVTAVRKILETNPSLLTRYDYVLLLDDDVELSCQTIERLFDVMRTQGLDLAQPALSDDSTTFFDDLKAMAAGQDISELSAVEIMAPVLSRRALQECRWVFSEGISGWGIDLLLSAKVKEVFGTVPMIIGSCIARHLRPYDTKDGRYYRFLQTHGIDANVENGAIALRYGLDDSCRSIRLVKVAPDPGPAAVEVV